MERPEGEEPILRLRPETYETLQVMAQILKMKPERVAEEALDAFFAEVQKQLAQKSLADDNAQTNLSYDEFWDGVDI
ncbi:hypothetical protein [Hydrogenimonas sp. SS33]|uniref:hypothetical protein n=1 Tax=Hydrogenimonas leucolamina TaxID=2954236 RepID=UPI00336BFA4B